MVSLTHESAAKTLTMWTNFCGGSILLQILCLLLVSNMNTIKPCTIRLIVIAFVPTLALFLFFIENYHLMGAILSYYFLQYPSPGPLFRAIHISIHLILEPFLICICHLFLVYLGVIDEADRSTSRLRRRRRLKIASDHLLLFCKFESIRRYSLRHYAVLHN